MGFTLATRKKRKRSVKNHVCDEDSDRLNTPCINQRKGDTLVQTAMSLPHQRVKVKLILGVVDF
eukprot:1160451-Pelagomonas_calceolata.AAC.7